MNTKRTLTGKEMLAQVRWELDSEKWQKDFGKRAHQLWEFWRSRCFDLYLQLVEEVRKEVTDQREIRELRDEFEARAKELTVEEAAADLCGFLAGYGSSRSAQQAGFAPEEGEHFDLQPCRRVQYCDGELEHHLWEILFDGGVWDLREERRERRPRRKFLLWYLDPADPWID